MKMYLELRNSAGNLGYSEEFDSMDKDAFLYLVKEYWPVNPGDSIVVHEVFETEDN